MVADGSALEWVLEKTAAKSGTKAPSVSAPGLKPVPGERETRELELWKKWKSGGEKPADLDPLMKSMENLIQHRVNQLTRVEVPTAAIVQVHKELAAEAFRTYDPKRGTQLKTHVMNKIRKGSRFVNDNKNFARIPENISRYIGPYNAAKSELAEKLGHPPDLQTIHDHFISTQHPMAGVSMRDLKRLEKDQRRGLIQSGFDPEELGGSPNMSSRAEEVKHLIFYELSPEERSVYEYLYGMNGKPNLGTKTGSIAKALKIHETKVSKIKKAIRHKMMQYLEPGDV